MPWDDDGPLPPRRPARCGPGGFLALMVAVFLGFALGAAILSYRTAPDRFRADPTDEDAKPRAVAAGTGLDADEAQAIAVFQGAKDSVVNVDTVVRVRNPLDMQVQEQQQGTGSGFVWDEDGRVVTNFHVVRQAVARGLTVRVVMADRTQYDARVVGLAPDFDLAVLQIPAAKAALKPLRLGSSAGLKVGQTAFAIGNPFGLSLTMTKGMVSALDREIESPGERPISGAIQTDAPINPGNSGGPLLDKDGRLIGVNTAIVGPAGGNVGIGFAIPADTVNRVVTELIQRGRLQQPDIGVKLVDQQRLRRAGYPTGVMIQRADPQGPAALAGLRGLGPDPRTGAVVVGDVIVAMNGQPIAGNAEFAQGLAELTVGQKVTLTVERDDKRFDVDVTVRGV